MDYRRIASSDQRMNGHSLHTSYGNRAIYRILSKEVALFQLQNSQFSEFKNVKEILGNKK